MFGSMDRATPAAPLTEAWHPRATTAIPPDVFKNEPPCAVAEHAAITGWDKHALQGFESIVGTSFGIEALLCN